MPIDGERGPSESGGDLGDLLDELFEDLDKVGRVLQRAFPGARPQPDEIRARREEHRRATLDLGPGVPRNGVDSGDSRSEAARLQDQACGKHTIYAVTARHKRSKPFASDWVGHTQSVRVTLPATRAEAAPIWTHLGVVKAEDHLLFSIEELVSGYAEAFGARPKVERVDLITGARHYDLDRFSPLSVFLAYERADDRQASFYVYESGSAMGNPAVLYWAPTMDAKIVAKGGFLFTPFARVDNTYTGKLIMNRAKTEPSMLSIAISQHPDGGRHYIDISASFEVVEPGKVIWPVADQIQAALRVFAIAQAMGCKLEVWEWGLGQIARSTFDWIVEPPQRGREQGYSTCSMDELPR
ncbi:hypothetical protein ENSA5_42240 [Enhygromyxa salina]|uniref:Uncharacterized protein n=1 Tax=Enhygromyxa salina TaxID=215803 RepID=A0A2S9XMA9_9BACT|nr:DUF1365 family protein [Enhygromyxa salina]PRP93821.1 hypothetical protein ENSA5_42240 [Enhygromyxa salina]